eukprot:588099-Pelagomonas_calceolata.AAC.1
MCVCGQVSSGDHLGELGRLPQDEELPAGQEGPEWMEDEEPQGQPGAFMMESLPLACYQDSRMQLNSQVGGCVTWCRRWSWFCCMRLVPHEDYPTRVAAASPPD